MVSSAGVRDVLATAAGAAKGFQPSAESATRWRALALLPPIHTGTGVLGLGLAVWPSAVKKRPSCLKSSVVQMPRSDEHTSELQSLMRISYAVFCLTTKHKKYPETSSRTTS